MPLNFDIDRILVDPQVVDHDETKAILARARNLAPHAPVDTVDASQLKSITDELKWQDDSFGRGKRVLYLTLGRGVRMHACPGTQKAYCCNLFVIDLVENCPFDCSYCYLQSHLSSPLLRINVNIEDYLSDMATHLSKEPQTQFRIGSGELSDSLALEPLTQHGRRLAQFFATQQNAKLELKTKSDHIDSLLDVESNGRVIVGWSVNPESVTVNEERGTAPLQQRLRAAEKVAAVGYKVAFHFDPIIRTTTWKADYAELIDTINARFSEDQIAWISLGTLRFPKNLRNVVKKRRPKSTIVYDDFVMGVDHKERYRVSLRADSYDNMLKWLRLRMPSVPAYLCMENPAVWQTLYGGKPQVDDKLLGLFSRGPST